MKRVIVFICLIILLIPLCNIKKTTFLDFNYYKITIVSNNAGLKLNANKIKSGNDYYYQLDKLADKTDLKNLDYEDVKGVVLYFSKDVEFEYFEKLFDFNITSVSKIDNMDVYSGYYKGYNDYRLVNGKKINFQLVNNSEGWVLGFPLIMTGF